MSSNKRKRGQLAEKKWRKKSKKREAIQAEEERKLHARAEREGLVPVDRSKLVSRSVMPSSPIPWAGGKFYEDYEFACKDCGKKEVWTARQQKRWHEEQGGEIEQIAVRCRDCRTKEKQRKEEARKIHMAGLDRKRQERGKQE